MFDNLWVEKYRPSTLDDMVLTKQHRDIFGSYKKTKEIPNLLFVGTAGIGKTSLAKIICKSILECQYLYINASDENGIDTIRTKVTNFSRTKSFDGNIKCVILDETDGLTGDAQRALRNTMEEHASVTRFILTANYNHRVIRPLQSRCQSFDLTPPLKECHVRIDEILKSEGVQCNDASRVKDFVKMCYPDLRKCINEIQKNVVENTLQTENLISIKDSFVDTIYKIISQGLALKARKKVIENEHVFNSDYIELLRSLFNYIHESNSISPEKKSEQLIMVSEFLYRSSFVVDQEINFYTCMLSLTENN